MSNIAVPYNKVFFSSDLHLNHKNIIKYCNRPFSSVEEMNEAIINNWNKVVPEDGIVFILGDFCFGGKDKWQNFYNQLNGKKYLILGNHDDPKIAKQVFKQSINTCEALDQLLIKVQGDEEIPEQFIFLCHYPMIAWPMKEKGGWHLFGHIHSLDGISTYNNILSNTQYDVGVDNNNYTPLSFQQIKEIITRQKLYGKSERIISENY